MPLTAVVHISDAHVPSSSSSSRAAGFRLCSRSGFAVLILCCASASYIYSLCQIVVVHPLHLIRNTQQQLYNNNSSSSSGGNYVVSSLSRKTRIDNGRLGEEEDGVVLDLKKHEQMVTAAPFHFVICTRIKNEAPYLREWIEYHRMIGFESFYLLNHNSTDATQCILNAYSKRGIVFQMRHVPQEHLVFDACVNRLLKQRNQTDLSNTWMATHDVDEFIWFQQDSNNNNDDAGSTPSFSLQKAVRNLQQRHRSMQSMFIPRFLFGSSGHDHYQPGLVINQYTRRFDPTGCSSLNSGSKVPQNADLYTHQQEQGRRRLTIAFQSNGEPTSFCNPSQNVTLAYHGGDGAGKGMSLVPALALDCRPRPNPLHRFPFCHGTHFHKLRNASDPTTGIVLIRDKQFEKNPTTLGDERYVGDAEIVDSIAIMHYMSRSREEFFQRTCSSRWIEKYQRCKECSPEAYFNMSETYTNNHEDNRMAPFAKRLETILLETSSSSSMIDISQCETAPPKTKPWNFYRRCWQRTKVKNTKTQSRK